MIQRLGFFIFSLATAAYLAFATESSAILANAWHIPDSVEPGSAHMRNPEFELDNSTTITIYSGVQKFNNSFGTANQTGGTLYYKGQGQGAWSSLSLGFDSNNGNNQYWRVSFKPGDVGIGIDEVIQYYLYLTFDSGADNTYIYAPAGLGDHGGNVTNQQSVAASSPYTIRNRPAFLFHASNRVINGTTVQFWTKAGYLSKDGVQNWVSNGALYYTTNGSTPTGSLGVAGANTTVVPLTLDHEENDPSVSGNATWWVGTATSLPTFTTINYKIGLWNSGNNEEKFADYRAPSDTFVGHVFTFSLGTTGDPSLTVNGVEANYTTSHLFVDEIAGDLVPLTINFTPNAANVDPATVQVFTNLNRRDFAALPYTDGNGIATEEGISPPSGDVVGTDDSHYYKALQMSAAGVGQYTATMNAQKTGAYRLTARYRLNSSGTWIYYSSNGRRDHAIVVSPKDARDINLYEINTLNINATGDQESQRSTFADLHNNSKRFNLNYLRNLGCNYLWFQPIHPNGIDGRQLNTDPANGAVNQPFSVGSPYAVKNFFDVMALMGAGNTRSSALSEFQGFVADADLASVGVMLDAPFNHSSYDAELAQKGVDLIKPGASPTAEIRASEARFYSNGDIFNFANDNYCTRASGAGNIAPAPDRNDFGKFGDTFDIFYGKYSALVCQNNQDNGNYLNESDVFDYSSPIWNGIDFNASGVNNNITRNVWRYFASYIPYWITQTGHSGSNSTPGNGNAAARRALDSKGIDALRADFGQGLPPQCWEYIINVARSHKWNFVFMTESLDGGAVTYRSNRHFDLLNENIVFPFKAATTTQDYRNIFDQRRSAYGQGLVLLNNTSHDEENYADPFQALIRYGVSNTIDGAPLVFYGQENGVSQAFGYSHYETNFGKKITHFKVFNDLGPIIGNQSFPLQQLYPVYAGMGLARQFSRALRSSNRYYLNQIGGSIQPNIFSVAKYETANGSPVSTDVVFGFMNLDRNNDQSGNFNVNVMQNGSNLFGIKSGRTYDVKNIAAYLGSNPNRRDVFLNRKTGSLLLSGGLFVGLNKVPTANGDWATAPFEAQYLKLYDVTAPSTAPGIPAPPNAYSYALGTSVTISWSPANADSEGLTPSYKIVYSLNGGTLVTVFSSSTSITIFGAVGQTLMISVQSVNPNDTSVTGPTTTGSTVTFIDPLADDDGDGVTNGAEDIAATNPFDPKSSFRVTNTTTTTVTWTTVQGRKYQLEESSTAGGTYSIIGSQYTETTNTGTHTQTVSDAAPVFYHVRVSP